MTPRIAIPEPTGFDTAYNQRSLPFYLSALRSAGAVAVPVPLHEPQASVARLLSNCNGVLLPGSKADIDPQAYGEVAIPECAASDPARQAVDELLLQDAFNLHKPILAICYGIQALNVWRNGSLIQHLNTGMEHRLGKDSAEGHLVTISKGSRLEALLQHASDFMVGVNRVPVNSSHHQAVASVGGGMKITAHSVPDGVIEALELDSSDHFVLGVQWHPERTYSSSAASRAIFSGFISAVSNWQPRAIRESVSRDERF
jgi:putative glutamine amidotransferase